MASDSEKYWFNLKTGEVEKGFESPSVDRADATVPRIGEWMSGLWDAPAATPTAAARQEVAHA